MSCFVGIDVPLLTALGLAEHSMVEICLTRTSAILDILNSHKAQLLISNALMAMVYNHSVIPSIFLKALANTRMVQYEADAEADNVSTQPNILTQELGDVVIAEMKAQLSSMHSYKEVADTVYVIGIERGFLDESSIQTHIEPNCRIHDMVHMGGDEEELSSYFERYCPKLVQLKHHQFAYSRDGLDVSPFSAYDSHNTNVAERLLKKAFDDYDGDYSHNHPPHALFTWDPVNKCYVCFHHSGRWEYHGYDLQPPYDDVPERIKEKYHIRQ